MIQFTDLPDCLVKNICVQDVGATIIVSRLSKRYNKISKDDDLWRELYRNTFRREKELYSGPINQVAVPVEFQRKLCVMLHDLMALDIMAERVSLIRDIAIVFTKMLAVVVK